MNYNGHFQCFRQFHILFTLSILLLLGLVLVGCATVKTSYKETTPDENGVLSSTEYTAKSVAAPFGKVDATTHQFTDTRGEGIGITVGQNATGLDNTGQAAALKAMTDALTNLVGTLLPLLQASLDVKNNTQGTSLDVESLIGTATDSVLTLTK